jgi:ABC-2 type transport system permease protein
VSQFWGVLSHEFNMSIRRKGLWIAYAITFGFFVLVLAPEEGYHMYSGNTPWQEAGEFVYLFNMFMPIIGGILAADRIQRDYRLGIRELQTSMPLGRANYILGKYIGVLLSLLLPMFIGVLGFSILFAVQGVVSSAMIGAVMVAFVAIAIPSFAFVTAFSLACPLVIPLRVYQILFTGYWFWGNFINNRIFPTISGTLLNSSGVYAQQGFFGGDRSRMAGVALHTASEAWLNILVLGLCAALALFVLYQYLAQQSRRA